MMLIQPPANPDIYHITHVDNLVNIIAEGGLWCDAQRLARGLQTTNIGHRHIKSRRLHCPVRAGYGGMLGDYVPFNFCPRSVMLYPIFRGHQDYSGGQEDIAHLVSDVRTATSMGRPWAYTDRHAELAHALHFADLGELSEVCMDRHAGKVLATREGRAASGVPRTPLLSLASGAPNRGHDA